MMKKHSIKVTHVSSGNRNSLDVLKPISLNIQNAGKGKMNNKENKKPTLTSTKQQNSSAKPAPKVTVKTDIHLDSSSEKKEAREETTVKAAKVKPTPLYVGDLDFKVDEKVLLEAFSKIGPVSSVKICRSTATGDALGYGYVNFTNADDAKKAMAQLNYTKLLGSEIRIMFSVRDQSKRNNNLGTNVFFSNLPEALSTREFFETFSKFGEILSCKINYGKRQGFILFKEKQDALKVVSSYNNSEYKGSTLFVGVHTSKEERVKSKPALSSSSQASFSTAGSSKSQTNAVVFVKNLPLNISETLLQLKFKHFGPVSSIFIKPVARLGACWALVTFQNENDAVKAIQELDNTKVDEKTISCTMAKQKGKKSISEANECCILCFKDASGKLTEEKISSACLSYGTISCIVVETKNIDKQPTKVAFVELILKDLKQSEIDNIIPEIQEKLAGDGIQAKIDNWKGKGDVGKDHDGLESYTSLLSKPNLWHTDENKGNNANSPHPIMSPLMSQNATFGSPPEFSKYMRGNYQRPVLIPISTFPQGFGAPFPVNGNSPAPNPAQLMFPHGNFNAKEDAKKMFGQKEAAKTGMVFKNIIQHFVQHFVRFNSFAVTNINIIASYIFEAYWDNDINSLKKFLEKYNIHQSDNNLLKNQVHKALKNLNNFDS